MYVRIYLIINKYLVPFKVIPVRYNTLMPAFLSNPRQQLLFRFFFIFSIVWFQCHSHTPMIRHQLWTFWTNLDHRCTSSTSSERCPCNVFFFFFCNFGTIFAAARFMPNPSLKIAWHEPNDMPTLSAISLIVIRQLSKIIFFLLLMCSGSQDNHRHLHLLGLPYTAYTTIELVFCL